jgi:hypothetical protein
MRFEAGLPREDSGKIMKRKLRQPYWAEAGRQRAEIQAFDVPRIRASLEVAVVRSHFLGCLGAAIDVLEKELAGQYVKSAPRGPPTGAR